MPRQQSMHSFFILFVFSLVLFTSGCETPEAQHYDLIIRNGLLYDGSGQEPVQGSLAVKDGKIVLTGEVPASARARQIINADGMAVSPGFINMLSWSSDTLFTDPRAVSDIKQGVTLEVMGESFSMGPFSEEQKRTLTEQMDDDFAYEITWTTLGEYLEHLVDTGVSPNVASFVGSGTIRANVIGYDNRPATREELISMQQLVSEAMAEGAMGLGSALIYVPDAFNSTGELVAMARAVAPAGGIYISHMRSEGDNIVPAVKELLAICSEAGVGGQIHHLKFAGRQNWDKFDEVIGLVEAARQRGMAITANMYTYTAGATGLDAAMPPWVQEGGHDAWAQRLQDPEIRARVAEEMRQRGDDWENLYFAAGPDNLLFAGFINEELRKYVGWTLTEVAEDMGTTPEEAAMDLVIADNSRVATIYFLMSEENVKRKIALPWMHFCSDSGAPAAEHPFTQSNPHPRAYGSFARLLGRYVREEGVISLREAIHRLTGLPAQTLKIRDRGLLKPGYWADIVIFNPQTISDNATFEDPHQYATGVHHVFINGAHVLASGEHTGATPGMVVRGPGWTGFGAD